MAIAWAGQTKRRKKIRRGVKPLRVVGTGSGVDSHAESGVARPLRAFGLWQHRGDGMRHGPVRQMACADDDRRAHRRGQRRRALTVEVAVSDVQRSAGLGVGVLAGLTGRRLMLVLVVPKVLRPRA